MTPAEHAAEREARIAGYAARIARGERLFEPTPAVPPPEDDPNRRACIACGRSQSHGWGKGTKPRGWVVRRLAGAERHGTEIHCPRCVKRWGFGDGLKGLPLILTRGAKA